MENLPPLIKEKLDARFTSVHSFSCPICGDENLNPFILVSHLKQCLNYLSIYSGNGSISFEPQKKEESSGQKRKIEQVVDIDQEPSFPLKIGYYNNASKTSNFEKGKCEFIHCVAKTSGQHIDRSVFVCCGTKKIHFCK